MKFFLLSFVILFAVACKNGQRQTNKTDDTLTKQQAPAIVVKDSSYHTPSPKEIRVNDTITNYSDTINFEKFYVGVQKRPTNVPINWESLSGANEFKTRIIETYKTNDVNFAGHYIMSVFGCGASCIMGFMVDVRDGKIYDLPLGEENSCLFAEDRALCKRTSKLFIAGVCKENPESSKLYYKAYLWDEDKKVFNKIEKESFLKPQ